MPLGPNFNFDLNNNINSNSNTNSNNNQVMPEDKCQFRRDIELSFEETIQKKEDNFQDEYEIGRDFSEREPERQQHKQEEEQQQENNSWEENTTEEESVEDKNPFEQTESTSTSYQEPAKTYKYTDFDYEGYGSSEEVVRHSSQSHSIFSDEAEPEGDSTPKLEASKDEPKQESSPKQTPKKRVDSNYARRMYQGAKNDNNAINEKKSRIVARQQQSDKERLKLQQLERERNSVRITADQEEKIVRSIKQNEEFNIRARSDVRRFRMQSDIIQNQQLRSVQRKLDNAAKVDKLQLERFRKNRDLKNYKSARKLEKDLRIAEKGKTLSNDIDVNKIIETNKKGILAKGQQEQGAKTIQSHLDKISQSPVDKYAHNLNDKSKAESLKIDTKDGVSVKNGYKAENYRDSGNIRTREPVEPKINNKGQKLQDVADGRFSSKTKSMRVGSYGSMKGVQMGMTGIKNIATVGMTIATGGAGAGIAKGRFVAKASGSEGSASHPTGAEMAGNTGNIDQHELKEQAKKELEKKKNEEKDRQRKKKSDTKLSNKIAAIGMALLIGATSFMGTLSQTQMTFDNQFLPKMANNAYSNAAIDQNVGDSMTQAAHATLKSRFEAIKNKIMYGDDFIYASNNPGEGDDPFAGELWQGPRYELTDEEIMKITRVCMREQGSDPKGVVWEVCLAANLVELGQITSFGTTGNCVYRVMRESGWFGGTAQGVPTMDYRHDKWGGAIPPDNPLLISYVSRVLRDGMRPLPLYINEHDMFADIISASNDGVPIGIRDRASYIKDKTFCHNKYKSRYTFYGFPDGPNGVTDPFGYTPEAKAKVDKMNIVMTGGAGNLAGMAGTELTPEKFIAACHEVCAMARSGHFTYGSSGVMPPCDDKIISCDRMIARALYNLGFTDQTNGGITIGNMRSWLKKHGWEEAISDANAIKAGSIVVVKGLDSEVFDHTFVTTKFDANSWTFDSYDQGHESRITGELVQPEHNVTWRWRKDDFLVFNIPAGGIAGIGYDGTKNLPELNCVSATLDGVPLTAEEIESDIDENAVCNSKIEDGVKNFLHKRLMTGAIYETQYYDVRTYEDSGNSYGDANDSYSQIDSIGALKEADYGGGAPINMSEAEQQETGDYTVTTRATQVLVGYDTRYVPVEVRNPEMTLEFTDRKHRKGYQHVTDGHREEYTENMYYRMLLSALTAGTDNIDSKSKTHISNRGEEITPENYKDVGTKDKERKTSEARRLIVNYTPAEDEEVSDTFEIKEKTEEEKKLEEELKKHEEYLMKIKSEYLEYACDLMDVSIIRGYDDLKHRTERDNKEYSAGYYSVEFKEIKDDTGITTWTTDDGRTAIADEHYHIEAAITFYVGSNPDDLVEYSKQYGDDNWTYSKASLLYGYYRYDDLTFWRIFSLHKVIMIKGSGGALPPIAKRIYQFLKNKGLSDVCIAGMLGNIACECGGQKLEGINPGAIQDPSDPESGIGLIQWSGDRRRGLENYASQRGKKWDDLDIQLEYMWEELFVRREGWAHASDVDRFKQCTTPEEAAKFFFTYCEMRGEATAQEHWVEYNVEDVRVPEAIRAYNMMSMPGKGGAIAGKIEYINQGDYSHVPFDGGNIQNSGCGICSIVMVLRYYGVNISVEEAAQVGDSSTSYNPTEDYAAFTLFAQKYGVAPPKETSSIDEAIEACRNGKAVIVHAKDEESGEVGHYYVIQGYGQLGPFVYDPGQRDRYEANVPNGRGESREEIASGVHMRKPRPTLTFFIY